MKRMFNNVLAGMIAAFAIAVVSVAHAADTSATPKPKRSTYPFYGTVTNVNASAGTVSLHKASGERVLRTDANSIIIINGRTNTSVRGISAGLYAHGTVHKDSSGEEIITKAHFDTNKPENAKAKTTAAATAATATVAPAATTAVNSATNAADTTVKKVRKKKKSATNTVDQATSPSNSQ